MAKIVVKSAKFGIVVKELDTANYHDGADLIQDLLKAIPDADWFEERSGNNGDSNISSPGSITAKSVTSAVNQLRRKECLGPN